MDIYCDHGTLRAHSTHNFKIRHDAVKLLSHGVGITAKLPSKLEQNRTTALTSKIAPADVLFNNYSDGQHLATDVTIA